MELKKDLPDSGEPNGFYNIPDEAYFASEGLSNSQMGKLLKSFAHYQNEREKPSKAKSFGKIFHKAILEPELFLDQYYVLPKIDRRTKEGKEEYKRFQEYNKGKTAVTAEEYENCEIMIEAVYKNPIAAQLLGNCVFKEIAAYKKINGVLCKAKGDAYNRDFLLDVKTTPDANPSGDSFGSFVKSVYKHGYHRQAAHYLSMFYDDPTNIPFYFLAIEKDPPFNCAVFELPEELLELGFEQRDRAISQYKEFFTGKKQKNRYMGYEPQIYKIECPGWMQNDEPEDELEWDV